MFMRRASRAALGACAITSCLILGMTGPARAGLTMTAFPVGEGPNFITSGPDGNLWFTNGATGSIGRMTPNGILTEFAVPTAGSHPRGIAAGPDGNLWFTEETGNMIGRVTPAGSITEFGIPLVDSHPQFIARAADGNLWFTQSEAFNVGRITPAGVVTEHPVTVAGLNRITGGPDGNLWITTGGEAVGRFTLGGDLAFFVPPIDPWLPPPQTQGIVSGPDGNVWVTDLGQSSIDRITPLGDVTKFPLPSFSDPRDITVGPDGALWFTAPGNVGVGPKIGRITTDGVITEFAVPASVGNPSWITSGPDDTLWFTGDGWVVKVAFGPERLPEPSIVGLLTIAVLIAGISEWRHRKRPAPRL